MALIEYSGIELEAIAAVVPRNIVRNSECTLVPREDIERIIKKTGIRERRFVDSDVCASDMAVAAARKLIDEGSVNKDEISFLIFVTQTPDYKMPFSASLIQHRLGLSQNVAAFDVNLGCSGFVYGLNLAYSLAGSLGSGKVLLLNGETRSKVYSSRDRATALLFGDAASAALISSTKSDCVARFSMFTDGSGADLIKVPAGGYRTPSSEETLKIRTFEDGSQRSLEHGQMNGMEVFNFSISTVPAAIKELLDKYSLQSSDLDFVLFHQANRIMTNVIAKKFGFESQQVPYSLDKYGNTSSVSIPLTLCSELSDVSWSTRKRLLLSGFGVGLSWANAVVEVDGLRNFGVSEI